LVSLVDLASFAEVYVGSFDPGADFYCSGDIDLIDPTIPADRPL